MARLTPRDRIERYADRIDAKLRADEQSTKTMAVFTDSALQRVLADCGFKKRGSKNVAMIAGALERRNVFADPPLTSKDLDWEDRVNFTRTPPRPRLDEQRVRFRTERDLETFLEDNFKYLFPGLKLVGRQFEVASGKIDILATDADGYVVIELKKDEASHDLVNRLNEYMDDVAEAGHPVRGLVVSESIDREMHDQLLRLAASYGRPIDWREYRLELVLRPVEILSSGPSEVHS